MTGSKPNSDKLFERARAVISRGLIERYFLSPGAKWDKGEYWTLNPLRNDKSIGSFHISESGQWYDHATQEGGDIIEMLSKRDGMSLPDAAKKIIEDSGGVVDEPRTAEKKKVKAIIPIPDDAFDKLNERLNSEWSVKKYGKAVGGWRYQDPRGVWCCTVRHERGQGEKDIIPYYWGSDGKWHQGNPINNNRPVYGHQRLFETTGKILITEGEKCADVQVPGYTVISWIGGTGQVNKTDWKTLEGRDVIIWPDNDDPGRKAARYIASEIKSSRIMIIKDRPKGWDIADAAADGMTGEQIAKFIEGAEYEQAEAFIPSEAGGGSSGQNRESRGGMGEASESHYKHLGYDDRYHYFLTKGSGIVTRISRGGFSKTRLLELAPLSYWEMEFPKKGGFEVDAAIDMIIRESEARGLYQPSAIRGSGVWLHNDEIIVNNGEIVTDLEGRQIYPNGFYHYVKSEKRMGDFSGEISTIQNGYDLISLFVAQGFETEFEALALLGWSLIAPFGGILKWRPHVWLSGPARSGKSWILENIVEPMVKPFYHRGTGKTSAPGIYRAIKNTACPILLDEMEPGKNANKDTIQKIEEKLELARNASSDFSSVFTLTSMSGSGQTEEFCVRSCFCFASIIPYISGEAIESRIIISRLKNTKAVKNKIEKTAELIKTGVMIDPMKYQRRIFRKLPSILENIEVTKKIFLKETGDQRKSDNLAPLFAAIIALINDSDKIEEDNVRRLIRAFVNDTAIEKYHVESDEDKLIFELLDYPLQINPGERVSVAELILEASNQAEKISPDRHNILQRSGIRMFDAEGRQYLAIASSHSAIKRMLADTMYGGNYFEILKRHEAKRESRTIRFASQAKRAILLDWETVRGKYFSDQGDESKSLFADEVLGVL